VLAHGITHPMGSTQKPLLAALGQTVEWPTNHAQNTKAYHMIPWPFLCVVARVSGSKLVCHPLGVPATGPSGERRPFVCIIHAAGRRACCPLALRTAGRPGGHAAAAHARGWPTPAAGASGPARPAGAHGMPYLSEPSHQPLTCAMHQDHALTLPYPTLGCTGAARAHLPAGRVDGQAHAPEERRGQALQRLPRQHRRAAARARHAQRHARRVGQPHLRGAPASLPSRPGGMQVAPAGRPQRACGSGWHALVEQKKFTQARVRLRCHGEATRSCGVLLKQAADSSTSVSSGRPGTGVGTLAASASARRLARKPGSRQSTPCRHASASHSTIALSKSSPPARPGPDA